MERRLREILSAVLPLMGVLLVLGAVVFLDNMLPQIVIAVIGILLIEAGVWKLSHQLFPEERRYNALRAEGDLFTILIRQLNAAAVAVKTADSPEARQDFEQIREEMRLAVERMAAVAGKTDAELAVEPEAALWPQPLAARETTPPERVIASP